MRYTFQAVYTDRAPRFSVWARTYEEARGKARQVARRALCLILRTVQS